MSILIKMQTLLCCLSLLFVQPTIPQDKLDEPPRREIIYTVEVQNPIVSSHIRPTNNLPTIQYFRPNYEPSTSYQSSYFYQNLLSITMTDDVRTNIVNIAMSQLGYIEGNYPGRLSGENQEDGNYTEYGYWYGMQDEWCAMFVSWCANFAGETNVPKHALCRAGLKKFIDAGTAHSRQEIIDGKYIPLPGDIIYFCTSSAAANGKLTTHVGIVTDYKDGRIYTIEGNTTPNDKSISCGGIVEEKSYKITNTYVAYICELL